MKCGEKEEFSKLESVSSGKTSKSLICVIGVSEEKARRIMAEIFLNFMKT